MDFFSTDITKQILIQSLQAFLQSYIPTEIHNIINKVDTNINKLIDIPNDDIKKIISYFLDENIPIHKIMIKLYKQIYSDVKKLKKIDIARVKQILQNNKGIMKVIEKIIICIINEIIINYDKFTTYDQEFIQGMNKMTYI